ncbi:MAG: 16S rRNA (cytosine(1402)-N(4))-methyltransferase RsmH [Candidatus Pacebacteria bacterium]|nr:16S rRNA (cytosine(1402)-N(4))-methyltransferase RsmH [Candidatus Paceibacterota bacterium]MDD4074287.1 16S rRNA (cytosine(1402)-N(4))-methyltransferase RsmH [Candidatus Paceibacterota bacterium]
MHIPVLLKEVIEGLNPQPNENYVDCTLSSGGHTKEILKRNGPNGKVLGIEIDKDIFEKTIKDERLVAVNDSYINLEKIIEENNFNNISGILLDVGMSSYHVDLSERGFSFNKDEPLIMTYGDGTTAEEIINEYTEEEIEKILREYGEEKFSRKIAKKICEERKIRRIKSTLQLVEIIKKIVPYSKIHPATRTFQALRIKANNELDNIEKVLPQALKALNKGGKLLVISFHSLEDRIVKNFMKNEGLEIITKKPIIPTEEEIITNPRSRSSKLRIAIKI